MIIGHLVGVRTQKTETTSICLTSTFTDSSICEPLANLTLKAQQRELSLQKQLFLLELDTGIFVKIKARESKGRNSALLFFFLRTLSGHT